MYYAPKLKYEQDRHAALGSDVLVLNVDPPHAYRRRAWQATPVLFGSRRKPNWCCNSHGQRPRWAAGSAGTGELAQ